MKIALGTKNKVKIEAAEFVFGNFYDVFKLVNVDAKSGVSETPMSFEEGRMGAKNRAERSLNKTGSDLAVGIEGYIEKEEYLSVWAVILGSEKQIGEGGGGRIKLPQEITSRLQKEDLEDIMDDLEGRKNIGQQEGAVGILTGNKITRKEFTEMALTFACSDYTNNT